MATKVYQLYDPIYDHYATVFPKWTKNGKVWNSEGAFKLGLINWLDQIAIRDHNDPHTCTPNFQNYQIIETNLQTVTQTKYSFLVYAKDLIDKRTKEQTRFGYNKTNCNYLRSLCGLHLIP